MRTKAKESSETRVGRDATRARRKSKRSRAVQGELFARTWGGARRGAGRKGRGPRKRVAHRARASFRGRCPLHVTLRLVDGLPSLRERSTYRALLSAMGGGSERFGMRLVHWSVLGNHMHLMVEATDRRALSRGMQGLAVRLARACNRAWGRGGRVFADRYHVRVLRSPTEVRTALGYLLQNAHHHRFVTAGVDAFSSGPWFDGWLQRGREQATEVERPAWLRMAGTWLLAHGWRRLGLLELAGCPSGP
jgi:putative transposase